MGTVEKGSMRQEKGGGEEWRRSARREKEAMWMYGAQARGMERRSINKVMEKIKRAMHWKMRTWKSMQFFQDKIMTFLLWQYGVGVDDGNICVHMCV